MYKAMTFFLCLIAILIMCGCSSPMDYSGEEEQIVVESQSRVGTLNKVESFDIIKIDPIIISNGIVRIIGSGGSDRCTITSYTSGSTFLIFHIKVKLEKQMIGGYALVAEKSYFSHQVASILFYGNNGNDIFTNKTSKPSTAHGGNGNDILAGGKGVDYLYGDDGDDSIYGEEFGLGGSGDDYLYGGNDNDVIFGFDGIDTIYGEGGDDTIYGGNGNDYLYGGDNDDILYGENGRDEISGMDGNDVLHGGSGYDKLFGGNHEDRLYGGPDADDMWGGPHNDTLVSIGGGLDYQVDGGSGYDSFWCDRNDNVTTSYYEETNGYVNIVDEFMPYSYNGGEFTIDVPLELEGQDLFDPMYSDVMPDHHHGEFKPQLTNNGDRPLFAPDGATADDIFQGKVGDCYFMAALSTLADTNPEYIKNTVVDLGDATYAVRFFNTTTGTPVFVRVDDQLWEYGTDGSGPIYAGYGQSGSIWVPIVEKAFAFFRKQLGTYFSLNNGGPVGNEMNYSYSEVRISGHEGENGVTGEDVINYIKLGYTDQRIKDHIELYVNTFLETLDSHFSRGGQEATMSMSATATERVQDHHKFFEMSSYDFAQTYFRISPHAYAILSVIKDKQTNKPIGLEIRNPYGRTLRITDFAAIYFWICQVELLSDLGTMW